MLTKQGMAMLEAHYERNAPVAAKGCAYVKFWPEDKHPSVSLDGQFTAAELRAIADALEQAAPSAGG